MHSTVKLARALCGARRPALAAMDALADPATPIAVNATAANVIAYRAPREELLLAIAAFISAPSPQLTNAPRNDRCMCLMQRAEGITEAHIYDLPQKEWAHSKRPVSFGGRPPPIEIEHACVQVQNGSPIPDAEARAEAELDYFAKAERTIIRTQGDSSERYYRRARYASVTWTLEDTPNHNMITDMELEALFSQAASRRAAGPDGARGDFARVAPREMARL